MGKLQVFEVLFAGNQHVYKPGDTLSGEVRIVVTEEKGDIRGIRIKCSGKSYTHWTESEGSGDNRRTVHYSWKIPFFKQDINLKGAPKSNGNADRITLCAGEHRFPFTFQIPNQSLPPPFENHYGYVRYYVKVTIDRPWKFDHHTQRLFSIFTVKDLNYHPNVLFSPSQQAEKTVCCLCCASGPIVLQAQIDKSGYAPGEFIFITGELQNNSSRSITDINIKLVQRGYYTAKHCSRTHHRRSTNTMAELKLDGCEAMGSVQLGRRQMLIPPIPPCAFESCPNIQLEYYVEIEADVSGTPMDCEVKHPVVIGTIPAFPQTLRDPNQAPAGFLLGGQPPQMPPGGPGYPPATAPPGPGYPPAAGPPQPGYPPAAGAPQPGYPPATGYPPASAPPQPGYPTDQAANQPPGAVPEKGEYPPPGQPGYPPADGIQPGPTPAGYLPPGGEGLLPPPPSYESAVGGPQEIQGKKGSFGTVMYAPQYPCYDPNTLYAAMGIPMGAPPQAQGDVPTTTQPQSSGQVPYPPQ